MRGTTPRRLLGIVLCVPAIFFIYRLYESNAIVRAKGFESPIFYANEWIEVAWYVAVAGVGVWLVYSGAKSPEQQITTEPSEPETLDGNGE